jgi:hypothetical protein
MGLAQSNLGSMVGKMSLEYFYTAPTKDERNRAMAWQFFVQLGIWSTQSVISSVIPTIPWSVVKQYLAVQSSKLGPKPKSTVAPWGPESLRDALEGFLQLEEDRRLPTVLLRRPSEYTASSIAPSVLEPATAVGAGGVSAPPSRHGSLSSVEQWWRANPDSEGHWRRWIDTEDLRNSDGRRSGVYNMIPSFRRSGQRPSNRVTGTAELENGRWTWTGVLPAPDAGGNEVPPGTPDGIYSGTESGSSGSDAHIVPADRMPLGWILAGHGLRGEGAGGGTIPVVPARIPPQIVGDNVAESFAGGVQVPTVQGASTGSLTSSVHSPGAMVLDAWTRGIPTPVEPARNEEQIAMISRKLDYAKKGMQFLLPVGVHLALPAYMRRAIETHTWAGTDMGKDHNNAHLSWMVQEAGRYARRMVKDNVNLMFSSPDVSPDGSTHISNAMAMGSFLPADHDRGSLHAWTDSAIEDALTRNMYYKTLNAALRSQKVFISCTTDLLSKTHRNKISNKKARKVATCAADNTGPEHLKACIPSDSTTTTSSQGEKVCYLYRWSDRHMAPAHHIEDPWGHDKLSTFDLAPADIIISSYLASSQSLLGSEPSSHLGDAATLAWGPDASFATDPTTPGMFTLPVCDTPYNWNGQTAGYSISDDTNPYSARKSLPCYCGPLGNETRAVWAAMRLDVSARRKEYLENLCPRQIDAKLDSELERFVAKCRLGVKALGLGGGHWAVLEPLCEVVIRELERRGVRGIGDLEQGVEEVMLCKILRKGKKCAGVKDTPISEAWREAGVVGEEVPEEKRVVGMEEVRRKTHREMVIPGRRMAAASHGARGREEMALSDVPETVVEAGVERKKDAQFPTTNHPFPFSSSSTAQKKNHGPTPPPLPGSATHTASTSTSTSTSSKSTKTRPGGSGGGGGAVTVRVRGRKKKEEVAIDVM